MCVGPRMKQKAFLAAITTLILPLDLIADTAATAQSFIWEGGNTTPYSYISVKSDHLMQSVLINIDIRSENQNALVYTCRFALNKNSARPCYSYQIKSEHTCTLFFPVLKDTLNIFLDRQHGEEYDETFVQVYENNELIGETISYGFQ
jgi:hypothetical protein